jgi:CHAT domain-containing protein/pimeloyl-ACP methyl ester carboxylesterase
MQSYRIRISGIETETAKEAHATNADNALAGLRDVIKLDQMTEIELVDYRGGIEPVNIELAEDDIIELEFSGGSHEKYLRWVQPDEVVADQQVSRDGAGVGIISPHSFAQNQTRSGLSDTVLKFFRVYKLKQLAEKGVENIANNFEQHTVPKPGIYQYTGDPSEPVWYEEESNWRSNCLRQIPDGQEADINTRKPVLLFLHGTASSTYGSFGELWKPEHHELLKQILSPYGDQIYALEHHTLTVSPMENALAVVRHFPQNTVFHLVSHSRGGLVGEFLCHGNVRRQGGSKTVYTKKELHHFTTDKSRAEQLAQLQALQKALHSKCFQIARFIRVACPARGTILASGRMASYLSVFFNVLNLISWPPAQVVVPFIRILAMAAVKAKSNPTVLPGLESMMPGSPIIALLNRQNLSLDTDLTVIAGDVQGSSLTSWLKQWILDAYYLEDNDIIVNTASMYGASRRSNPGRFYLDQGKSISHFSYFDHEVTIKKLLAGLQGKHIGEFQPLTQSKATRLIRGKKSSAGPITYLIPGMFGSHLSVGTKRLWLNTDALISGGLGSLGMDNNKVYASGLFNRYYPLQKVLSADRKLVAFPYDWRKSCIDAAGHLNTLLLAELESSNKKRDISILAHSSGGLVVRALMAEYPETWQRLVDEANIRVVMLGSPLQGTFSIVQLLTGQHHLLSYLNMLDRQVSPVSLARQFAHYPGVLELLPQNETNDYFSEKRWRRLLKDDYSDWPGVALLSPAKTVLTKLNAVALDPERITYVAGNAQQTVTRIEYDDQAMHFVGTEKGDGVTLWRHNPPLQTWFADIEHHALASQSSIFPELQQLLDTGTCSESELKHHPLPVDDAVTETRFSPPTLFPTSEDLQGAALGRVMQSHKKAIDTASNSYQIHASVVHGNIEHLSTPVVIGHYKGDYFASYEDLLNERLGGQLHERHRLGRYPEELNDVAIFLNPGRKPRGVIVIGLGDVGRFYTESLIETYSNGLIEYALKLRNQEKPDSPEMFAEEESSPPVLDISTILVGTSYGGEGDNDLGESIRAMLRAVVKANQVLHQEGIIKWSYRSIQIVELYEDLAVESVLFLKSLIQQSEFSASFTIDNKLNYMLGGKRRISYHKHTNRWQRLQIEGTEDNGLKYTTITERARAELLLQATQQRLINRFVEDATRNTSHRTNIGKTLFELLIPNELKDLARKQQHLVLLLNRQAAHYPWELLQDKEDVDRGPIVVNSGVIRQLQTSRYRQVVINPENNNVLVIGDPRSRFPPLDGAVAEADYISRLFKKGKFDVVSLIRKTSDVIISALHTRNYRILHLAGHGVYNYAPKGMGGQTVTGMVLGEGIFLTSKEIHQIRRVPELVFINCCHLGKEEGLPEQTRVGRHHLAANLAQEFIEMGVRAVIAAGWEVDDDGAKIFSKTCYKQLLSGCTFGEAVTTARKKTYESFPDSNTWGAYQCYGDPDYVLMPKNTTGNTLRNSRKRYDFVSINEALILLENMANEADSACTSGFTKQVSNAKNIRKSLPDEWLQNARIQNALGRLYGKLDLYAKAIQAYDLAANLPQDNYPVCMQEDLVSLKTAWALAIHLGEYQPQKNEKVPRKTALFSSAIQLLNILDKFGVSVKRLEERGKTWKRKAITVTGKQRPGALEKMEDAYARAHTLHVEQAGEIAPYPLFNWLSAKLVRFLRGDVEQLNNDEIEYWIKRARTYIDNLDAENPTFCTGITVAECMILRYMLHQNLGNPQIELIVVQYELALQRGAGPRKTRFVSEHLVFLIRMLTTVGETDPEIKTMVEALTMILKKVRNRV